MKTTAIVVWTVFVVLLGFILLGCGKNPIGILWKSSLNQDATINPVPTDQVDPTPTPVQTATQPLTPTITPTVTITTYTSTAFHPDITKVVSCPELNEFSFVRGYVRYSYHGLPWSDDIEMPAIFSVAGVRICSVTYIVDVVNKQVVFYFAQPDPDLNTFYCVIAEVYNQ